MLVAVNQQFKNRIEAPAEFGRANHSFQNVDISLQELADLVKAGHPFCAQHENGNREKSNFTVSGVLAADIDHGLTIEAATAHPFVRDYGGFVYTTVHHTEQAHRFRIVFELEEPITDRERMEHAVTGIISKFGSDRSCKDACRIFFGNDSASVMMIGKRLPRAEVDALVTRGKEAGVRDTIGKDRSRSPRVTVHSRVSLNPDVIVTNRSGDPHRLIDLPERVSIHCPVHVDSNPSAFTVKNKRGGSGVHCSTCCATYWIANTVPHYNFDYHLRRFRDKTVEEWEASQPPDLPAEYMDVDTTDGELFDQNRAGDCLGVHFISEEFLSPVDTTADVILVKSRKGSGKTEWLAKIVEDAKRDKKSVLLIGHRQSLIMSTAKRLGLEPYIRIVDDQDTGRSRVDTISPTRYYAICLDSIPKLLEPSSDRYDVVIIDESEQVVSHLTASTLRDRRRDALLYLQFFLKKAQKVYCLDADLNRLTVQAIGSMIQGKPNSCLYLINDYVGRRDSYHRYFSKNQLVQVLYEHLASGRRCFVCSNAKTFITKLQLALVEQFGSTKTFKLITSDNAQSSDVQQFLLALPNSMLAYDAVLVSPAVGTGVDITFPNNERKVDSVFGFFSSRVNTHFDIDQQLCRVRHPGSVHVWLNPEVLHFETDPEVLRREVLIASRGATGIYELNEDGTRKRAPVDELYATIYAEVKSLQRGSKNALSRHFFELRRANGWGAIDVPPVIGSAEIGKELMERGEVLVQEAMLKQLCEAPQISSDEYADLVKRSEGGTLLAPEVAAMRRHQMEEFYRTSVSPELVKLDNDRRYQHAVRQFELVTRSEAEARSAAMSKASFKKDPAMRIDFEEPIRRRKLLIDLFSSAGIFREDIGFDRSKVVTKAGLGSFVTAARARNIQIQELLDKTLRGDLAEKATQQLGTLLREVGLALSKIKTKRRSGGTKEYFYQLNAKKLDAIEAIVANRRTGRTAVDAEQQLVVPSTALQLAIEAAVAEHQEKVRKNKKATPFEQLFSDRNDDDDGGGDQRASTSVTAQAAAEA